MPTRRFGALVVMIVCLGGVGAAQEQIEIQNWPAPPYWAPPGPAVRDTANTEPNAADAATLEPLALPTEPLPFIGITPCRLIDTRNPVGTYGGPPLVAGVPRSFPVAGQCGVAANAGAVSVNATVTNTQGAGFVALYPEGSPFPGVSNVNYTAAWQTVANAAIVPLGPGGFTALAGVSGTDLIVDINGYYAPVGVRSVFGRTGAIVGVAGDYTASLVTNVPAGGIVATDVQGALNGLDTGKAGIVHTHTGSEIAGLTSGGVTFGNAAGHLAQNASQLFWDQTNSRLGIGTSAPAWHLDVNGVMRMPNTTVSGVTPTAGVLVLGGQGFLHNYAKPGSWGDNTFLGLFAGNFTLGGPSGQEGSQNTAIGAWSLNATTTGHENTAAGWQALRYNTAAGKNVAVGSGALSSQSYTNGGTAWDTYNTALGSEALAANNPTSTSNGYFNTAVGASGLFANTTGWSNTAVGAGSMLDNLTGGDNTAVGSASLASNLDGTGNTAVGHRSLYQHTTGGTNTAVGRQSLESHVEGYDNTALGAGSLAALESGSGNAAVGRYAGRYLASGDGNILLGGNAGSNLTAGNENILIGNLGVSGDSNTIRIGTAGPQQRAFVAGIRGVTPEVGDGLAVIIDSNGQLGTSATVGAVASVFGRTGAVTAQAGDYTATQVTNAPAGNISSTTAQAAVNELDTEKAAVVHTHGASGITGLTSGGVTFGNASGNLAQDANQLYWDHTNRRLGLGTSAPQQQLELTGMMRMPPTAATAGSPSAGVLFLGTEPFLHNYAPSSGNTFVGAGAGNFAMTGINNTGLGDLALDAVTTGAHNIGLGHLTLMSNTEGSDNTSVGSVSLPSNTVGNANTAAGYHSLYANTAAGKNTAVGKDSLYTQAFDNGGVAWDSENTAVGFQALYTNNPTTTTNGNANTAVGNQSLYSNTTGKANTAVGIVSLYSTDTGSENTALGYQALYGNLGGSYNIGIGYGGGSLLTTGSNNIAIGNYGVAGESSTIRIGSAPNQTRAFIAGIFGANVGSSSAVYVNAAGQLGTVQSSLRYKQDVQDMGETSTRLLELRPVTFHYRNDPEGPLHFGLIAEEVEQVLPELVVRDATGQPETVAYHELPAMLLNELQQQHAVIQSQQAQIGAQQAQIQALMARLEALEANRTTAR